MKPSFPPAFALILVFSFSVVRAQDEIVFQTEGSQFHPLIALKGEAQVRWIFADDDTLYALNPEKDYGSEATRLNRLYVNPWSAVKMINIGYDAGDGGSYDLPFVADQQVSRIENLDLVKNHLEIWCSSYNQLDTLILDDFILLDSVECFLSTSVRHVSLRNTPSLTRLCLEDNNLTTLDVSECPQLMDLRGAVNNYPEIRFSDNTEEIWHICIRDNPQLTHDSLFSHMELFPGITELYIWSTNQKGKFEAHNCFTNSWVSILASDNHYSSLDFSGGIIDGAGGSWIIFNNNEIRSVNLAGFDEIYRLELNNNGMAADTVDKILCQIDQLGMEGFSDRAVFLRGNERPTALGMAAKANLEARGWIVEVEGSQIQIYGNDSLIANGDENPRPEDGTDFGPVIAGEERVHRFVIQNQSPNRLYLTGNPLVRLGGADTADFRMSAFPGNMIEWWGGTDTLEITFAPRSLGTKTVWVSIEHDAVNTASPFVFSLSGEGRSSVSDTLLGLGELACFGSLTVLIVAGDGSNVTFQDQSVADLIASESILLLPGFQARAGSRVHAWITPTGELCTDLKSKEINYIPATNAQTIRDFSRSCREQNLRVFPNPGRGTFTLQAPDVSDEARVVLVNMNGKVVFQGRFGDLSGGVLHLNHLEKGTYLLLLRDEDRLFNQKVMIW